MTVIRWVVKNDKDRDFMIDGNLEPNKLIKIAESLEKNKKLLKKV